MQPAMENTGTRRIPLTDPLNISRRERAQSAHGGIQQKQQDTTLHMNLPIAEIYGNITSAFGLLGAAIGVGLIGFKAAEVLCTHR